MSEEQNWNDLQHLSCLFYVCLFFSLKIGLHSQSSCRVQVVAPSHRSSVKVFWEQWQQTSFAAVCSCVCISFFVSGSRLAGFTEEEKNIVNPYCLAQISSFPRCSSRTNTIHHIHTAAIFLWQGGKRKLNVENLTNHYHSTASRLINNLWILKIWRDMGHISN